ncbi:TPA: hypothetical protein ACH3X1_000100 [Trebouxia sp. C0004]
MNLNGSSLANGVLVYYARDADGDVTKYDLPSLKVGMDAVRKSLVVSMIANVRLKKQALTAKINRTPYTLGLSFKSVIVNDTDESAGAIELDTEDLESMLYVQKA